MTFGDSMRSYEEIMNMLSTIIFLITFVIYFKIRKYVDQNSSTWRVVSAELLVNKIPNVIQPFSIIFTQLTTFFRSFPQFLGIIP